MTATHLRTVLIHELTHAFEPGGTPHGDEFIAKMYEACSEAFGVTVKPRWSTDTRYKNGARFKTLSYAMEHKHLIPFLEHYVGEREYPGPIFYGEERGGHE